jgi:hypothetical protein
MSNNYHTQLNQQSGILNEIASTLQFDQRPGIGNSVPRFDNNVEKQRPQFDNAEKRQQQHDISKSWNNYGHVQGTPIVNNNNNERVERDIKSRESKDLDQTKQDEIQLSDIEQHNTRPVVFSPQEKQVHNSPKIIKEKFVPVVEKTSKVPISTPASTPIKKYAIEYALIPLSLVGIFILLVHPTSATYLEKYLPKMADLKGCAIRGAILAIVYIVIKIIISQTIEKN